MYALALTLEDNQACRAMMMLQMASAAATTKPFYLAPVTPGVLVRDTYVMRGLPADVEVSAILTPTGDWHGSPDSGGLTHDEVVSILGDYLDCYGHVFERRTLGECCDDPACDCGGMETPYDMIGTMLMELDIDEPPATNPDRLRVSQFGNCPRCFGNDGYLNVSKESYFVCHQCRVCWGGGYGLFSTWEMETEDDWARHRETLDAYERVEPAWIGKEAQDMLGLISKVLRGSDGERSAWIGENITALLVDDFNERHGVRPPGSEMP